MTGSVRALGPARARRFPQHPIASAAAARLVNILAGREGHGSTAVTSQFDPEDWYESLHDAVIAESILKRIVSNAEIVQRDGPNMRRHTSAATTGTQD